jgi:hypothetical protein
MTTRVAFLISFAIFFFLLAGLAPRVSAQPLPIGIPVASLDSCLSRWDVKACPAEEGDSACFGAKFWDLNGHMLYHVDSTKRLIKVDWLTYLPVAKPEVDSIAKNLNTELQVPLSRARDEHGIYWIWDNEEVHYLLSYCKGTVRLLEFEDQSAFQSCSLQH